MHNSYAITLIFIISSIILAVRGAAIPKEEIGDTVYHVLQRYSNSKCPSLKTTKLLDPTPLQLCSRYPEMKGIEVVNQGTSYDVLCLLYYNNYISLCNMALMVNLTTLHNSDIDNIMKYYDVKRTCQQLPNSTLIDELKEKGSVIGVLKDAPLCHFLCDDNHGKLDLICSLAAVAQNITEELQWKLQRIRDQQPQKSGAIPKTADSNHNDNLNPHAPALKSNIVDSSDDSVKGPDKPPSTDKLQPVQENAKPPPQIEPKPVEIQVPEDTETKATDQENKQQKGTQDEAAKQPVAPSTIEMASPGIADGAVDSDLIPKANQEPSLSERQNVPPVLEHTENTVSKVSTETKTAESPKKETPPTVQDDKTIDDSNYEFDNREEMDQRLKNEEESADDDGTSKLQPPQVADSDKTKTNAKPQETDEDAMIPAYNNSNVDEEDSFFFIYFMMVCAVFILGYIGYHNKQKVLALVIEGRRGRRGSRRGRPNSANYHKLDSNLEEAVTSSCNKNTTSIIY